MRVSTILTPERIATLLADRYGIADLSHAEEIPGASTGHVWKIETAAGNRYVLKEFTPTFSLGRVSYEPELVGHLRQAGMKVAKFYPTLTGEYTWLLEGRPLSLQEFLDGEPTPQCEAPLWLMEQSAQMLGDLHSAMAGSRLLPARFNAAWFAKRHDLPARQGKIATLLKAAEALPAGETKEQILEDLNWRLSKFEEATKIAFDPSAFTVGNVHGDYNVANILVKDGTISAVIDFSNACRMPLVWEVLRSYTLGSPECAEAEINLDSLKRYVAWYMERHPLNEYDLRMVGRLTYFHIIHSQFGYAEYLLEHAQNWQALIGYASWHVKLAQWLEAHMEEVEEALAGLQEKSPAAYKRPR